MPVWKFGRQKSKNCSQELLLNIPNQLVRQLWARMKTFKKRWQKPCSRRGPLGCFGKFAPDSEPVGNELVIYQETKQWLLNRVTTRKVPMLWFPARPRPRSPSLPSRSPGVSGLVICKSVILLGMDQKHGDRYQIFRRTLMGMGQSPPSSKMGGTRDIKDEACSCRGVAQLWPKWKEMALAHSLILHRHTPFLMYETIEYDMKWHHMIWYEYEMIYRDKTESNMMWCSMI